MRVFSYQLYSSRNFGPLPETLKLVAGLGYKQVEGYGGLYASLDDSGKLKDELAANGLTMPTGHFSFDMVANDPQRVLEISRARITFCRLPPLNLRAGVSGPGVEMSKRLIKEPISA